jgi:hypothetical protein
VDSRRKLTRYLFLNLAAWADMIRHATVWNSNGKSCPMLAHIAVSPLLVQTGVNYVRRIDHLLSGVPSGIDGVPQLQLLPLARLAVDEKRNEDLDPRERTHLKVLDCLLKKKHKLALAILGKHLQACPGDCLGLSLLMDLAQVMGDQKAASRGAGAVAQYWAERQGTFVKASIPGYHAATSLIALGTAVGRLEAVLTLGSTTLCTHHTITYRRSPRCGGTACFAVH